EIVLADESFAPVGDAGLSGDVAPRFVDANDDAVAVEDRDLGRERCEDGPVQLLARTHRARRERARHRRRDALTRGAEPPDEMRRPVLPEARLIERQRADRYAVGNERNLELCPTA